MEALGEGVMNALACEAVVSRVWYALPSCDPLHAREAALGDEGQHTLLSLQHTPSALLLSRNNHQSTRTWRSHTQVRPSIACGGDMYGLVKNLYTYLRKRQERLLTLVRERVRPVPMLTQCQAPSEPVRPR